MSSVRRRMILDGAYSAFVDGGLSRTSLDRIAIAAGVTKPTIYSYFTDKQQLFTEAIKAKAGSLNLNIYYAFKPLLEADRSSRYVDGLSRLDGPRGMLLALGWQLMETVRSHDVAQFTHLVLAESRHLRSLADLLKGIVVYPCSSEIDQALRAMSMYGTILINDTQRAAETFVMLVISDIASSALLGIEHTDAQARRRVNDSVDTFLKIYGPAPTADR